MIVCHGVAVSIGPRAPLCDSLSFMSLLVPCVKCSTWAVSFCCTATQTSPRLHLNSASTSSSEGCSCESPLRRRLSAEYCETSSERLLCGIPTSAEIYLSHSCDASTSAECFEAPPPHLPRSSFARCRCCWEHV